MPNNNVKRIVLTGGPCAGKTTALVRVIEQFSNLGYKVFTIPEVPTTGVLLENGVVRTNRIFKTLNDVGSLTLRNITIQATDNNINIDNSRGITFDNVTFYVPGDSLRYNIKGGKAEKPVLK